MADDDGRRRYRGILTPADRNALRATTDREPVRIPDAEAQRHARYRIRQRTKQALRDLAFLFFNLPTRDRRLIFEEFVRGEGRDDLVRVLELFFLGISDSASAFEPEYGDGTDDPLEAIEWFLRDAVGGAQWKRGYKTEVRLDLEVDRWRPDPEETLERVLSGYGTNVDLVYLTHWCDDVDFLEHVIESGESYRFVRGPAARYGSACVQEFTPEDARYWRSLEDDGEDEQSAQNAASEGER